MLTLNTALTNLAITLCASGGIAAALYLIEGRLHNDYNREFLKGIFLGTAKLLFIYLIVIPVVLGSPAPANMLGIFRLILLGLVTILLIELVVYAMTHFIQSQKELLLIGIIGGITRSEAIIAEFLSELRENPDLIEETVLVIILSSTTMVFRNLLILAVVDFSIFAEAALPLLLLGVLSSAVVYHSYRKSKMHDIELKPVSLKTAFEIVFIFTLVTVVAQYLSGYTPLLYLIATVGALGGALPIVFSAVTLLSFGQIGLTVAATMAVLATTVAYMDDAFLALIFRQGRLAKELFLKQVPIALLSLILFFYLTGQLTGASQPLPWHYYLAIPGVIALFALIALAKRKISERREIAPDTGPPGPEPSAGPEPSKEEEPAGLPPEPQEPPKEPKEPRPQEPKAPKEPPAPKEPEGPGK